MSASSPSNSPTHASLLSVPSPATTANRRWSPLSYHGMPRTPRSPPETYSSVSSPMSIATPTTVCSVRSTQSQQSPHHRFDAMSPTPTAYSIPSYTSSITLAAPPAGRGRLARIPGSPPKRSGSANSRTSGGMAAGAESTAAGGVVKRRGGFCRRVFRRLSCSSSEPDATPARPLPPAQDYVKIDPVHWTEQ